MKIVNWLKNNKLLLAIVALGAFLRLYKLSFQDIWIDEIFSLIQSSPSKSYGEIYEFLRTYDQHPPLYYFSIHFFTQILGHSTYTVRLFSVLIGVGGIFSIYSLCKEFSDKKAALFAAILLCINPFHIYYSQEGRMYSLLFLTTTLSFYFLVKFIKLPSYKSAIIYSFFSALMIYSHFFALFTLFSQYFILLFFVINPYKIDRKKFFIYSLITGIITLLLYIPALFILFQNTKITSIWIQLPTADFFTQTIKDFFGNSEIVLFFVVSGIIVFFLNLYKRSDNKALSINPNDEKQVFAAFVLISWILITFIIPLIYSFINLPMLINRYLINILPAVIIMIAIGLNYIKNNFIKFSVISVIVLFALTDLFIVKDYYNKVTKSEFTKLTEEIKKRNPDHSKVVTYWSWLLPYFFDEASKISVENSTLEDYVNGLKSGTLTIKPFWYADGNSRPFTLSPQNQDFINKNFILKEKLEYYDVWANYYVPLNNQLSKNTLNLDMFNESTFDGNGSMVLFENATKKTDGIVLEKGHYELEVGGYSLPAKPIKNENAHIIIKMNNLEVANFSLSENPKSGTKTFSFNVSNEEVAVFKIIFDNDTFYNGMDRNAIITSIKIKKNDLKN